MVNQKLLDTIEQQLKQGINKEQIKSSLLSEGYQAQDIDEVLNSSTFSSQPIEQNNTGYQLIPASINKRFLNNLIDWYTLLLFTGAISLFFLYFHVNFLSNLLDNSYFFTEYLVGAIIFIIYNTIFESIWQKTPAKFITKTKVLTKDGKKPSVGVILLRSVCRLIPFDMLSFLFSNNPVGWHDKFSKTIVIDEKKNQKSTTNSLTLAFLFIGEYIAISLIFIAVVLISLKIIIYIRPSLINISNTVGQLNTPAPPVTITLKNQMIIDASQWKTYTMRIEGLSFKYPADWSVQEDSSNGSNNVSIKSPNGFEIEIQIQDGTADTYCDRGAGCKEQAIYEVPNKTYYTEPVEIINKNLFIVVNEEKEIGGKGTTVELGLASYKDCDISSCREGLGIARNIKGVIEIYAIKHNISVENFVNDPNIVTAKKIVSSIYY